MSQQVADVLRKALEAFGPNGEHWTQGEYAKDSQGSTIPPRHSEAVSFCGLGACRKNTDDPKIAHSASIALSDALGEGRTYWVWQDYPEREFSEVKGVFEKAIATEEAA